jgi:hypothetical protein
LIHLWHRRRYDEIAWAAIDHLLAAVRKNARRLRIEQWLLLAVRTAILLLFAVALADPVIRSLPTFTGVPANVGNVHTLLVLDGSYSMGYRQAETSRFESAVRLATEMVHQARQGDAFTLVCMTDEPFAAITSAAYEADSVVTELQSLRRTDGSGDLLATLSLVRDTLDQVRTLEPRLIRHRVCFITDLGKTTWGVVNEETVRSELQAIAAMAELECVDVGVGPRQNAAVVSLRSADPMVTLMHPTQLLVELANFGQQEISDREIAILVNGERIWDQRVRIPAGGRTSVTARHTFRVPGIYGIEARLGHDRLPVDDHRWLSLEVREAINVLCVEGQFGAARNIALALAPDRNAGSPIRSVVGSANALLEEDPYQYDAVFLSNIGRFTPAETDLLDEYVSRGGGLVIFLGDQVQLDNYNRLLGEQDDSPGLLGSRLITSMAVADYPIDPLDYEHPIVEIFRGNEQAGLLTTPIWKYVRLAPHPSRGTVTALALRNGDPLITTCRRGRGRVILVATAGAGDSLDRGTSPPTPWTAWPAWPSFPPLVHEMLAHVLSSEETARVVQVGEPIESHVPPTMTEPAMIIEAPDGDRHHVSVTADGVHQQWRFTGTQRSGLYHLRRASDDQLLDLFAVNLDTRESLLDPFDPARLPGQFARDRTQAENHETPREVGRPNHYFRYLLAMVLGLLVAETCLAWFFGRPSS